MYFFVAMTVMSLSFVSCSSDDDGGGGGDPVLQNSISAKWEIQDSNSPYASFEFNKDGNYIVVMRDAGQQQSKKLSKGLMRVRSSAPDNSGLSPVHFGTYRIEGDKIILSGFGVMEVISITNEEFTFSFTLQSTGETNSYVASKAEEPIASSSRTEMLCRTWNLNNITIDVSQLSEEMINFYKAIYGANWQTEIEKLFNKDLNGAVVLFSRAGTYLVLYDGEEGEAGLSEWKWANQQETTLYYSWDNWNDDWSDNIVTIKELKTNSLVIQEGELLYHLTLKK